MGHNLRLGYYKTLRSAVVACAAFACLPLCEDVRDVVAFLCLPLVVEAVAVGLHVIKPDLVGAAPAGLGEDQDGRAHPGVGFKDAAGHGDDAFEAVALDDLLPDLLVRAAAPEEHAVGHDHGRAPARAQHPEHEAEEEEFGFFALDDAEDALVHGLIIKAALKRGIGEDQGEAVADLVVGLAQRVPKQQLRLLDAVQHEVHGSDADHRRVKLDAGQEVGVEVLAEGLVMEGIFMVGVHVFPRSHEEARRARARVADAVRPGGLHHFDHELDDVAGRAELTVLPGAGDLAEEVLVEVALGVAVAHVDFVDGLHRLVQEAGGGDHEGGVLHVGGEGIARAAQGFHEVECARFGLLGHPHGLKHDLRVHVAQPAPAQVVLVGAVDGVLDGRAQHSRLFFLEGLHLVEPAEENQVSDLLDDRDGVGDAARPEGFPEAVDFGFELSCDHGCKESEKGIAKDENWFCYTGLD